MPLPLQAVVGGTSCSGVLVCLLRIATKATFPNDLAGLRASTTVYFVAAGIISAASLVAHLWILPSLGVRPSPGRMTAEGEHAAIELVSLGREAKPLGGQLPSSTSGPPAPGAVISSTSAQQRVYVLDADDDGEEEEEDSRGGRDEAAPLRGGRPAGSEGPEDLDEPVTQVGPRGKGNKGTESSFLS